MKLRVPLSLILSAAAVLAADLPVKQVVLYKHGVGFFERSGKLAAGESARLDFNAAEMNDVLKSLTIGSSGGGKITGGVGGIGRTLMGVLILAMLSNGLNLIQISSYIQNIVVGVIIVLAVYIDLARERRR